MLLTCSSQTKNPEIYLKILKPKIIKVKKFKRTTKKKEELVKEVSRIETCNTKKQRQLVKQIFFSTTKQSLHITKLFASKKKNKKTNKKNSAKKYTVLLSYHLVPHLRKYIPTQVNEQSVYSTPDRPSGPLLEEIHFLFQIQTPKVN